MNEYRKVVVNLKGRDRGKKVGLDGRMILKRIIKYRMILNGHYIYHRRGRSGGLL
jgi:ribosomal protein L14E/L6E/L27E